MKFKSAMFALAVIVIMYTFTGCISLEKSEEDATTETSTDKTAVAVDNVNNKYTAYENINIGDTGISWNQDQILPSFSSPAELLHTLHTSFLSPDERVMFSALQGIVNKTKPQILLTEDGDVSADTWAKTFGLNLEKYTSEKKAEDKRYEVAHLFKEEIKGFVVYDCKVSVHYRNVASTIANAKGYLPVTPEIKDTLSDYGIVFSESEIIDITDWKERSALRIYERLYNEYWSNCSKRILLSANPESDFDHCRDIAAAVGAAVVYLDCTDNRERELYQKFIKDMADNKEETAVVLGWFTTERSGVIAGSEYGISTIPADLYISGSVYGGIGGELNIPAVPAKDDIENKVYIAVFMTDGDNIQYVQRFMRKLWDNEEEKKARGNIAVNWTISPVLADIGRGMMNYYYNLATEKECFVSGPSGAGYLMPINTNEEHGVELKNYLTDTAYMDVYTKITEIYLQRTGLRTVTIWDDANSALRDSFEKNCRYLYGATIQNFGWGHVTGGIKNDRLGFLKHQTHYEGNYNFLLKNMKEKIDDWSGEKPLFLSYQIKVWSNEDGTYVRTPQIVSLYEELKKKYGDTVEFVRADHFFALYNEANKLPFNLCMNKKTTVTASDMNNIASITDGTVSTVWTAENSDGKWIKFDLGDTYAVNRYVIRRESSDNTSYSCELLVSEDGQNWKSADLPQNMTQSADIELSVEIRARYVKIICENADGTAVKISDVEIYGKQN